MGEKFTTQRATKVAASGFPVAVGCHGAIELTLQLSQVNAVACQFMKVAVQPIPLLGIVVIWTNLPEIRAFLRTGEALQYASEQGANYNSRSFLRSAVGLQNSRRS